MAATYYLISRIIHYVFFLAPFEAETAPFAVKTLAFFSGWACCVKILLAAISQ